MKNSKTLKGRSHMKAVVVNKNSKANIEIIEKGITSVTLR